jgi:hypothetical protein
MVNSTWTSNIRLNVSVMWKRELLDIRATSSYCECISGTFLNHKFAYPTARAPFSIPTVALHFQSKFKCQLQKIRIQQMTDWMKTGTWYWSRAFALGAYSNFYVFVRRNKWFVIVMNSMRWYSVKSLFFLNMNDVPWRMIKEYIQWVQIV